MKKTPNVVLVVVDEWRAQSFGYKGDPNAHTPVIDAFAAESVDFDQAIAGTPVCCPARASFVTGQYPLTHGVYINDVPLKPRGTTIAEAFKAKDYDTAYIGKWHLYGSPRGWFERRESYIPPSERMGFDYWKASECTHDYNHSFYYEGDDATKRYWDGYDALAHTTDAIEYIRSRENSDRPYFLMLSYGPPHFPLHSAPAKYRLMYENRELELRPNVPPNRHEEAQEDLRGYYAHIAAVDECFGQLIQAVDRDSATDTIVVFTADHGDMMWSQGLEYKLTPWEESVRVPLLVRHRGTQNPRRTSTLLSSPDLMPTVLGFAGLPIPESVEGSNLSLEPSPETAFLTVPVSFSTMRWNGFSEYRGVRDGRYTYVRSAEGPWLLYDNVVDPYQMYNLCGEPALAVVQERMESHLLSWLEKLGDEFLPGEEYLKRDGLAHYFEANEPLGYTNSPWKDWASTIPRGRLWSVDTPLELLVGGDRPRQALELTCPALQRPELLARLGRDSPRVISMLHPTLLREHQLRALDALLLQLPPRDQAIIDQVPSGRGSASHSRTPDGFNEEQTPDLLRTESAGLDTAGLNQLYTPGTSHESVRRAGG